MANYWLQVLWDFRAFADPELPDPPNWGAPPIEVRFATFLGAGGTDPAVPLLAVSA
jgi:hypothetical protein